VIDLDPQCNTSSFFKTVNTVGTVVNPPNNVLDAQAARIMLQLDGGPVPQEVSSDRLHPTCNASPMDAFITEELSTPLYRMLSFVYTFPELSEVDKYLNDSDTIKVPLWPQPSASWRMRRCLGWL
jgi:hypothetical protein